MPKTPVTKKKINVSLDMELVNKINDLANKDNRSVSGMINHLLRIGYKQIEDKTA